MKAITGCQVKFDMTMPQAVHLITLYMAGVTGDMHYVNRPPEEWKHANHLMLTNMVRDVLKRFGESAHVMAIPDSAVLRRQEMLLNIKGVLPIEALNLRY